MTGLNSTVAIVAAIRSDFENLKRTNKYGNSRRKSASEKACIKVNHKIQQTLGNIVLPKSYIEFLKKKTGIDFNGLVISRS